MKMFMLRDCNENGDGFLIRAETQDEAIKRYVEFLDMPPGDWDESQENALVVERFELPTAEKPVIQI
jgi:hypothetical protein